jgi:hypothetical protein
MMESFPVNNKVEEKEEAPKNPNSIGEMMNLTKDLPTSPDKVYRSVRDMAAIDDLIESGVVRNAQSAGVKTQSRWDDKVFWSRGEAGKFHIVSGVVIEAPYDIASKRAVTKDDVTGVFKKNEEGRVENIWAKPEA